MADCERVYRLTYRGVLDDEDCSWSMLVSAPSMDRAVRGFQRRFPNYVVLGATVRK
jgi:hypothetical protein